MKFLNKLSNFSKFLIILSLLLGYAIFYFGFTALGGTDISMTLNLAGVGTTLDDGLTGHYTFDGKELDFSQVGAEVRDRSSGAHHLAATVFDQSNTVNGTVGQAAQFDGSADYTTSNDNLSDLVSVDEKSISLWMRPQGSASSQTDVWDLPTTIADDGGYFGIHRGTFSSQNRIWVYNWDGNADTVGVAYSEDEWTHITLVHGGGTLYLYKDGELAGSTPSGNTTLLNNVYYIGSGSSGSTFFEGSIDDVRIYDRQLSADEIKQLYRQGATTKIAKTPEPKGSGTTIDDGLVGHWTFDGSHITTVIEDQSPENNDAVASPGTATTTDRGVLGQAMTFDDFNDLWYAPHDTSLDITGDITISLWIKRASTTAYGGMMVKSANNNSDWDYGVYLHSSYYPRFYSDNTTPTALYFDSPILDTAWYHLIIRRSGSTVSFFRNGQADGGGTMSGSFSANSYPLRIGKSADQFNGDPWGGSIDDARLYNRALSDNEIQQLYRQGATTKIATTPELASSDLETGLIGHWTFDGGKIDPDATNEIIDSSGSGNDGNLIGMGGGITTDRGVLGQAMLFADSQYVDIGSIFPTSAYTKTAWFKMNGLGNTNNNILSGQSNSSHALFVPSCKSYTISSGHSGSSCASGNWDDVQDSISLDFDKWYFVAVTYDSAESSGTMKLYRDGVEVDSATSISAPASGDSYIATFANASGLTFNGNLDDVRLYNRALSADEVERLYELGR